MKIKIVQFSPAWENSDKSINIINQLLSNDNEPSDLIIFPEMSLTGFSMSPDKIFTQPGENSFDYFSNLALKKRSHVFAGMVEKINSEYFNTLVHFDDSGKTVNRYKKIHPFSMSGEDQFYSSGNNPIISIINENKIGLSICYDLRFPELYRQYGKNRTKLIINIANWPDKRIYHWDQLLLARAIENQCYVIGVNRVGNDPFHKYVGHSSVIDPFGNVVRSLNNEPGIINVELDFSIVDKIRMNLPFLEDIKLI